MIPNKMNSRKPNLFENILLFMGIIAIGVGYFFVHVVIINYGLFAWQTTISMLLWMIVIILFILTAVNENSKEELKIIISQQHDELKLLRDDFRRRR